MILAINTSTPQFGLAFLDEDGTILAEYYMAKEKGFGSFMPALHFLLTTLKADIHDQKAVIVATGPGSFTGLRVGLSAAKGLCHGLEIPVIGVSSLEALAFQIPYSDLPIAPVLYSRKNEFFISRFSRDNGSNLIREVDDMAIKIEALPTMFEQPTLFIGNDFSNQSPAIKKILGSLVQLAPPQDWNLKASTVGALGLKRFHAHDFDEPQTLAPQYLRPPDIRPSPFPLRADPQRSANSGERNTGD